MNRVAEFAKSKIGCGYIYGATGWIATQARIDQQKKQYPNYVDLSVVSKWIGKQCFDCAQLVKAAAASVGVKLPSGATSQYKSDSWSEKGTIDTMPDEPGIILFRQSEGKMQHVEVYIGGGYSAGARSSKIGVGKFTMSGYRWTHWARLKIEQQTENEEHLTVTAQSGSTVFMRSEAAKSSPYIMRVPVGANVVKLDVAGDWTRIRYAGSTGWMMSRFLKER